jgi:DNA invertase Pin-like site-specific DNA recombinase
VLFRILDRFSREGVRETLNHLQHLNGAGVSFKSFTKQYLDSTGVFRAAIIAILAAIAQQERTRFSERIKARQARSSKKPGRPALAAANLGEVRRLRAQGLSLKRFRGRPEYPWRPCTNIWFLNRDVQIGCLSIMGDLLNKYSW